MRRKQAKLIIIAILIFVLALGLDACKKQDKAENVSVDSYISESTTAPGETEKQAPSETDALPETASADNVEPDSQAESDSHPEPDSWPESENAADTEDKAGNGDGTSSNEDGEDSKPIILDNDGELEIEIPDGQDSFGE